ncbi:MAG TPA: hypothetical protein VMT16_05145, partial [Thermoanaerobaculia bacterium]|nr:hypothetical protein [Thermoanaerobaculia bacterium]
MSEPQGSAAAAEAPARRPLRTAELSGEVAAAWDGGDLPAALPRLLDPAAARETLHWGRNYLYVADWPARGEGAGGEAVVVKQFRNQGWRRRLDRRLRGSRAERSWRMAWALRAAGIGTPEPVLWMEGRAAEAPSWLVTRHLAGWTEARYYVRALNAGEAEARFPDLPSAAFLAAVAALARRLHDRG